MPCSSSPVPANWISRKKSTIECTAVSLCPTPTVSTKILSTVDKLVDYCMNTPVDGLSSSASVETLKKLIDKNLKLNIKY